MPPKSKSKVMQVLAMLAYCRAAVPWPENSSLLLVHSSNEGHKVRIAWGTVAHEENAERRLDEGEWLKDIQEPTFVFARLVLTNNSPALWPPQPGPAWSRIESALRQVDPQIYTPPSAVLNAISNTLSERIRNYVPDDGQRAWSWPSGCGSVTNTMLTLCCCNKLTVAIDSRGQCGAYDGRLVAADDLCGRLIKAMSGVDFFESWDKGVGAERELAWPWACAMSDKEEKLDADALQRCEAAGLPSAETIKEAWKECSSQS